MVLTGRPGFFSAGADLKLMPTLDAAGQRRMVEGINRMAGGWYGFPRPVVAAVNGHAIAGGMVLALCADHRVGSTEGRYGLTEVAVAVPYPVAAAAVVRAELPHAAARRAVLDASWSAPTRRSRSGSSTSSPSPTPCSRARSRSPALARSSTAARSRWPRTNCAARRSTLIERDAPSDPLLGDWTELSAAGPR